MKEVLPFEVDEKQAVESGLAVGQEISALLKFITRPQDQVPRWDGWLVVWEAAKTSCDQLEPTWPWLSPGSDLKTHDMLLTMHKLEPPLSEMDKP